MNKKFEVDILTPNGKYLHTEAEFLGITSTFSTLGILANHAPLITKIAICKIVIKNDGRTDNYATSGGVMQIKDQGHVFLMLEAIEHSSEIDVARATEASKRAQEKIDNPESFDIKRAKLALARALNRINVYNLK